MLETIALNLTASALATGGTIGVEKVRDILQRKRFSEDVDALATTFNTALKDALEATVHKEGRDDLVDLEADWSTIAEELDTVEALFENEEEAAIQITNAIAEGLRIDLDSRPALRGELEAAVADAYQQTLQAFADRVAGTDLADILDTETSIEVTATVNQLDDRLTAIQDQLRRQNRAALQGIGVTWLDPLYFQRHPPGDPEVAWRTEFNFAAVKADYPLPRERPPGHDDGDRQRVTDEILARLNDGENLVVLGDGGSGKSTTCKQVACQWQTAADRGPVFYRSSSTRTSFDDPSPLIEAITAENDPVLVVVEDAATGATSPVWDMLNEFAETPEVSFLFDSRESVWRDTDELAGAPASKYQRNRLGVVEMPALDSIECQRAITHYEDLTGAEVGRDSQQLYEHLQTADIGGPLVLAYELTGPAPGASDPTGVSALHDDVHEAYLDVEEWADEPLARTAVVMVNVLNAAGLPVTDGLIHALADDRADHRIIERTMDFLEGTVIQMDGKEVTTPHQEWSVLYFDRLLEADGERLAREQFEDCVAALFRLCDDQQRRQQVTDWLRDQPSILSEFADAPGEQADRFVTAIATIADTRPGLGVLYGTPTTWRVPLPDTCSTETQIKWHNRRGRAHLDRGALDAAEAEIIHCEEVLSTPAISEPERRRVQAGVLNHLGAIAHVRGEFDTAEDYYQQCLDIRRELDDRQNYAQTLNNLGLAAIKRGELDTAKEYLDESLTILQEVDDRHGQAQALNNLGMIAADRDELETAEEYYQQSLEILEELGDRHGQARTFVNLAEVVHKQGESDTVEEYYQQSLAVVREIGDRAGEATILNNLGKIANDCDKLDTAEEYLEESLKIKREVSDRDGQAQALTNLGVTAYKRGELDSANEYYEKAFELARMVGNRRVLFKIIENLVKLCEEQGNVEAGIEWCERGIEFAEAVDVTDTAERFRTRRAILTRT
jgi:tetratricopeptide (TPR) repeat protein